MEHDVCNVIYLDKRALEDRVWTRDDLSAEKVSDLRQAVESSKPQLSLPPSSQEVENNIQAVLAVFQQVSVHRGSTSCIDEIKTTYNKHSERNCTILLIDIPSEEEVIPRPPPRVARSPSPTSGPPPDFAYFRNSDTNYGMNFLLQVSSDIRARLISPLVIPVALLSGSQEQQPSPQPSQQPSQRRESLNPFASPDRMRAERFAGLEPVSRMRYFDAGAADVLTSPTSVDRVRSLPAHAHWSKLETERRTSSRLQPSGHQKKTSWVGTRDDKPYTQVKEAMVSELMEHICNPELEDPPVDPASLHISSSRHNVIVNAFGSWSFSAHQFTDDELLHGIFLILEHTLKLDELDKWRLSKEDLLNFLMATRRVYNSSVLYHNFRHACDVTQALFTFLVRLGAIPPLPGTEGPEDNEPSPLATLIDPFHSLLLLISAIGHDVGHPGVNNGFLVTVNAPLAQLYNDRSVLESFHCAAYSQILRRRWKSAFNDRTMRKLMITSILATDMGEHREYMSQMEKLQETLEEHSTVEAWSEKMKEESRGLVCCLLIKCADICNVARDFEVGSEWARILIDEFYAQGQIEQDLNVPSALFGGPPDPDSLVQKCQSQIGFMNVFGYPLFGGISKILPGMKFTVDAIDRNKDIWQDKAKAETDREKEQKQRFEDARTKTLDNKATDDRDSLRTSDTDLIQSSPNPSSQQIASSSTARRASGGVAAHFAGLSHTTRETRRASLGPPTAAEQRKQGRSSASENRRRSSLLRFIFCCGAEQPDEFANNTFHSGRGQSTSTGEDEMHYNEIKGVNITHNEKVS